LRKLLKSIRDDIHEKLAETEPENPSVKLRKPKRK